MTTGRLVSGLVVLSVLAAGCSQDSQDGSDERSSEGEAEVETEAPPPDAAIVESYVDALAEGKLERAMRFRCRDGRHEGDTLDQFGDELERLTDRLGTPSVARVWPSDPPTELGAWVEGGSDDPEQAWREERDAVELKYAVAFDGVEVGEPQLVVVLTEDGERRICGHGTHVADDLFATVDDGVSDAGLPPVAELSDLMPADLGDAYELFADEVYTPEGVPDALDAYTKAWQEAGVHAGARVTAIRFSSPEAALGWAAERALTVAGDAVEQFDVPGLEGEAAVRISASAWLLIQPTGEPPFGDQVTFAIGDVGVEISVTRAEAGADTAVAVNISRQVADLASS